MFTYCFHITDSFKESFLLLPIEIQDIVRKKLKFLELHPTPLQEATKLRGYNTLYRFRIQEYRAVFELEKKNIFLLLIKHRKDIYKIY